MPTQPQFGSRQAFGPFEVDPEAAELLRNGIRIRLGGQPFQILTMLLASPGTVVTRDELRERIWSDGTFVDFEHSLNAAINKLRRALGDSADRPRYIETVPGRGYRFIGPIQPPEMPAIAPPHRANRVWLLAAAALLMAALTVIAVLARTRSMAHAPRLQQVTTNSADNPVLHAVISPDGRYVAYGDEQGIQVRLIATGESRLLPRPASLTSRDLWIPAAWFPDGTKLVANSLTPSGMAVWAVSVIGGSSVLLRDQGLAQSVSPDGSRIAFIASEQMRSAWNLGNVRRIVNSEIRIMNADGTGVRRLVAGDDLTWLGSVRWSPDGNRIAFQILRLQRGESIAYSIETADLNGRGRSTVFSTMERFGSIDHIFPEDFCWLADGRILYAVREAAPNSRDSNLWAVEVDTASGKPAGHPTRITSLAGFQMEGLSAAATGNRLLIERGADESFVYVAPVQSDGRLGAGRRLTPDERYNTPFDWTPDSRAVIFRSDRTGSFAIYRQPLDESVAEQLPLGPVNPLMARVTSNGWLLYNFRDHGAVRLMRAPLAGGPPEQILTTPDAVNFDCPRRSGMPCIIEEYGPGHADGAYSSFDPLAGVRKKLFNLPFRPDNWTVSPDGLHIALDANAAAGGIEVRSLDGRIEHTIQPRGWPRPTTIDWAADSKTILFSHPGLIESPSGPIGTTVLRVDFEGHVQPLWETRGARYAFAISSPDGKYIALRDATTARNAWLLEDY